MVLTRQWVRASAGAQGDREALISAETGRRWHWSQLLSVTEGAACQLRSQGVGPGTAVAFSVLPSAQAVIAFMAVLRAGATVVAIDPAAPSALVKAALRAAAVGFAVCENPDGGNWGGLPGTSPAGLCAAADRFQPPGRPAAGLDESAPDDIAVVCFTSGTTGEPKAVPLTHAQVLTGCQSLARAWEWTADDVLVSSLPLFHVHGLLVAVAGSLTAGGTLVVRSRFDPEFVSADIERYAASMFFAVPTMWWRLAEAGVLGRLQSLRLPVSGSAPLSPELFGRLRDELGQAPVERYGMTETMILTSNPVRGPRKPGSVGQPLPGVELRLGAGWVVEARAESIMNGYLNRSPGEGFTADGWWRTGDIGRLDADGYLFLQGRASDLIITGGHNVQPAEVERALASVLGVAEVAVAGVPDERWGQIVGAFVVAQPGVELDRLLSELRSVADLELAPSQRPRQWRFLAELPRNALGKVTRSRLAVMSAE